MMFADDLVLIAEGQGRLQEMVSDLDQLSNNYGIRISRDKTKVMVTSREPIHCDIELDGETNKQVDTCKYLGSKFARDGGCKEDTITRYFTNVHLYLGTNNQHDHQDTVNKLGVHPNYTLQEWKLDPRHRTNADVSNNRDEVYPKSCRKDQHC